MAQNKIDIFCSFGLPYISPSYRGDINMAMRAKIKTFYQHIGDVVSIFIDRDYVRVVIRNLNQQGVKFKEIIDKSLTDTINTSWENTPGNELKHPKHLRKYRVKMWHSTKELPEKARPRYTEVREEAYRNIASNELEKCILQEEMDLFEQELEFEENNETVYLSDEESETDDLIEKFNKQVYIKKHPLIVEFDDDSDDETDEEVEEVQKTFTKDSVIELMKLMTAMKGKTNFTVDDMEKLLK